MLLPIFVERATTGPPLEPEPLEPETISSALRFTLRTTVNGDLPASAVCSATAPAAGCGAAAPAAVFAGFAEAAFLAGAASGAGREPPPIIARISSTLSAQVELELLSQRSSAILRPVRASDQMQGDKRFCLVTYIAIANYLIESYRAQLLKLISPWTFRAPKQGSHKHRIFDLYSESLAL